MYIKICGALLIVACCGGIGILFANTQRLEVRLLHQLLRVLELMKSELSYRLTSVPQLCRICSDALSEPLRGIFAAVADKLDNQTCVDAERAFHTVLQEMNLPSQTKATLQNLGQTLGRFDLQGQLNGFSQCAQECTHKLNELECNQQQRLRSYRTLGFCAGVTLAILLF